MKVKEQYEVGHKIIIMLPLQGINLLSIYGCNGIFCGLTAHSSYTGKTAIFHDKNALKYANNLHHYKTQFSSVIVLRVFWINQQCREYFLQLL